MILWLQTTNDSSAPEWLLTLTCYISVVDYGREKRKYTLENIVFPFSTKIKSSVYMIHGILNGSQSERVSKYEKSGRYEKNKFIYIQVMFFFIKFNHLPTK